MNLPMLAAPDMFSESARPGRRRRPRLRARPGRARRRRELARGRRPDVVPNLLPLCFEKDEVEP